MDIQMLKKFHSIQMIYLNCFNDKAITSLGVLTLWEEGKFNLDDPIEKYIPDFRNSTILMNLIKDSTYTTIKAKIKLQLESNHLGIGYGVRYIQKFSGYLQKKWYCRPFFEDITIENNIKKLQVASSP